MAKDANEIKKYQAIPKYPPIIEDLSFIIPEKTYIGEVMKAIKTTSLIIQNVELIDSYENTRTFRITYQDAKKTLTDKEVEKIRKKIIETLKNKLELKFKTK